MNRHRRGLELNLPKFAIIGAGNGGQAFAGHLKLLGMSVSLYDVEKEKVEALQRTNRMRLFGAVEGEAVIDLITHDIGEAMQGADIIMVVIPAVYQNSIAQAIAPFLVDNQIIVLNPGATGGALEVRNTLRKSGAKAKVIVGETETLLYACRSIEPGVVQVYGIKDRVNVATLPAVQAPYVSKLLGIALPQFQPVESVLHTSLNNPNAMLHPTPTLLNAGRIESRSPFDYYSDGVTPSIAKVVEKADHERLAVAEALGITVPTIEQWYYECYRAEGINLYDIIQHVDAYKGIKGPVTLNTRYLFEDVATGLVPLSSLGRAIGVKTPTMDAVIELTNTLLDRNFWKEGRSLENLGLAGLRPDEIRALVLE
jgi:opine dehydrogenase